MRWEKLCGKAKELGYNEANVVICGVKWIEKEIKGKRGDFVLSFNSAGTVICGKNVLTENRTYEQMYAIMEALR